MATAPPTRKPTSVTSTRLVDEGRTALAEFADGVGVSPTMLARALLTHGLRTVFDVPDEVVDDVLAKVKTYRRTAT